MPWMANLRKTSTVFTGNHNFWSPGPERSRGLFDFSNGSKGVDRSLFLEAFPQHDDPLHYALGTGGNLPPGSFLTGNTTVPGGVPYNQWATHELYWVDGTFTYVIIDDDIVPGPADHPRLNTNTFSPFELCRHCGAWGSGIALPVRSPLIPMVANFVIYDNLEFAVASAGDVPVFPGLPHFQRYSSVDRPYPVTWMAMATSTATTSCFGNAGGPPLRWTPPLLAAWQGAYGNPVTAALGAVPEPSSLVLLFGLAGCGLLCVVINVGYP